MSTPWTKARLAQYFQDSLRRHAADHPFITELSNIYKAVLASPYYTELFLRQRNGTELEDDAFERCAFALMFSKSNAVEDKTTITQDSRLLALAPELRNRIYEYAVFEEDGVKIGGGGFKKATALLRTCSQIREEAGSIFYSINTFRAKITHVSPHKLVDWLRLESVQVPRIPVLSIEYSLTEAEHLSVLDVSQRTRLPEHHMADLMAKIFIKQGNVAKLLLPQMAKAELSLEKITTPQVELPSWEEKVDYMAAHTARSWSRTVAEFAS